MSAPQVEGGLVLECVGGPLDGRLVFLSGGTTVVDVGYFNDVRRTVCVNVPIGAPNYLGYYVPRSFENGAPCDWRHAPSEHARDTQEREQA